MKVQNVDYRSADAAEKFVESLRTTGFGVIRNHPISHELVEKIYAEWAEFFSSADKLAWRFDPKTQDGLFPADVSETAKGHTARDLKEYYHIYPWGKIPDSLRENAMEYYRQAEAFAAELLSWVEAHSPAEVAELYREPLSNMIKDSGQTLLRVLHYPPMTGSEEPGAVRAAAHEDINLLTVLPAANEPGLQVMDVNGEWMDVPCDPGQLVINVGDMLQETSGGYFPSTTHRVINPTGEGSSQSRLSLPLFLHPRPEVVLSDKHTADSYLKERLRELGVI
ncbi:MULTISPECIES: isopenicillin N synthase family dioxygenase [unclassified Cobetia]|uniref:isopenicillin N synthase family dioxygenase n=1 Tax=unclassified Cobetia TaxID=2609414 RepID=UPI00178CEE8C|nr:MULTISPECIES: isopenicillin N synthase family oxygenase [unclassified Cobetia]MBE2168536.1 isopenicillin N synthase family oxygenase [Cobetia sp. 2AS1]MDH2445915.1 isopenicillin N synthase family oxygenase [Cobetia sp. 2AS]